MRKAGLFRRVGSCDLVRGRGERKSLRGPEWLSIVVVSVS